MLLPNMEEANTGAVSIQDAICDLLDSRLALSEFSRAIIGQKSDQVIVVHMNLVSRNGAPVPDSEIGNICYMLCDILKSTCCFLPLRAIPQPDLSRYLSAPDSLHLPAKRFFHKENAVLFYEEKHNHLIYQFSDDTLVPFEKALQQHDEQSACEFISALVEKLRRFDGTLVSSVKNFFIRVYRCLYEASKLYGSSAFSAEETLRPWMILFGNCPFDRY